MPIRILYDGWPLVHNPLSAAAWHLRTLLEHNPRDGQPIVALPTEPGAAILGKNLKTVHHHTHDRGAWEQRILPRLAEHHHANLIHTTSPAASLFGKTPTLVSPTETVMEKTKGRGRLGEALGRGGLARATILWPEDLPEAKIPGQLRHLPPVVHSEFTTRAAASIGELYPLVVLGLDEPTNEFLRARLPEFHVQDSVHLPKAIHAQDLPNVYRACTALVHLGSPAPWGNALRHALSCGKAIVAHQESNTEAIVGS
ncbi:MAG: glycosyltransferase, partial [Chloroflexi bacterium]|nr:glycosyltransferase [Chloroflexota bacterium]